MLTASAPNYTRTHAASAVGSRRVGERKFLPPDPPGDLNDPAEVFVVRLVAMRLGYDAVVDQASRYYGVPAGVVGRVLAGLAPFADVPFPADASLLDDDTLASRLDVTISDAQTLRTLAERLHAPYAPSFAKVRAALGREFVSARLTASFPQRP